MNSRRIAVVGTGYVGLTAGACLASLGHDVVCVDIDSARVAQLGSGTVTLLEEGLPELVAEGLAAGRLRFTDDLHEPFAGDPVDVVFLCLPTPMGPDGAADLSAVTAVLGQLRDEFPPGCVVAIKSTVPVGTSDLARDLIGRDDVFLVSNPEFLREGSAVEDFLRPDRVVAGSHSREAAQRVLDLYAGLGAVTRITTPAGAELVKYASNCFLALKVSYVNVLAELSERFGADVRDVVAAMGDDHRIGGSFLAPGPGWGGSCFPKDTNALLSMARSAGVDFALLRASLDTNRQVRARIVDQVRAAAGGTLRDVRIGLFGLTFKAGTDDVRDSPALAVAELLHAEGAILTAYDPTFPVLDAGLAARLTVTDSPSIAVKGASVLVVLTEWPQFRELDWGRLAELVESPNIVDTRNLLDPEVVRAAGFSWTGNGRSR
ncbi:UDP-glucose dehydrogenase family protein [Lentzea sp. CA-135723]|uniref:UDP-glucose dehydrogenase family protein n=1 Tax=Lentzea sp. CA-135723 TaxID=3239950 RepID=UPI003D948A03